MAIEVAARMAEKFLDRKGYEVLGLTGEPEDWCLVARDGDGELAFVAVDFLADSSSGFPEEDLGKGARRRMERLSLAWLAKHDTPDDGAGRLSGSRPTPLANRRPAPRFARRLG